MAKTDDKRTDYDSAGYEVNNDSGVDYFDDDNNLYDYTGIMYNLDTVKPLKRHYYPIELAAQKLGWSVSNLIHYGATNQIDFVFPKPVCNEIIAWHQKEDSRVENAFDFLKVVLLGIGSEVIFEIEHGRTPKFTGTDVLHGINYGKVETYEFNMFFADDYRREPILLYLKEEAIIQRSDLCIMSSEVQRIISGSAKSKNTDDQTKIKEAKPPHQNIRAENTRLKVINALIKELKEKYAVPESNLANVIVSNSELLGDPVAKSSVYDILLKAKQRQK